TIPWDDPDPARPGLGLPRMDSDDYTKVGEQLQALDEAIDSVSDVLVAEGVYQLVQGNPARAGATLDAIATGQVAPPELEVGGARDAPNCRPVCGAAARQSALGCRPAESTGWRRASPQRLGGQSVAQPSDSALPGRSARAADRCAAGSHRTRPERASPFPTRC